MLLFNSALMNYTDIQCRLLPYRRFIFEETLLTNVLLQGVENKKQRIFCESGEGESFIDKSIAHKRYALFS